MACSTAVCSRWAGNRRARKAATSARPPTSNAQVTSKHRTAGRSALPALAELYVRAGSATSCLVNASVALIDAGRGAVRPVHVPMSGLDQSSMGGAGRRRSHDPTSLLNRARTGAGSP